MQIRFMGLICHVDRTQTGDDLAVVLKATNHFPKLRIPNRYLHGRPNSAVGNQCESLEGRTISFDPLGAGTANRAGLTGVPRLSPLTGGGEVLHPNVATRDATDPSDNLQSFVILPAGVYGVEDRYDVQAIVNGVLQCVTRTVIYEVPVPGAVTQVSVLGLPISIVLKPHAVITITNLEPIPNGTAHFGEYGKLFSPPKVIASLTAAASVCANGTKEYAYPTCDGDGGYKNIGVECTNSTYP
jgi:hypothetical protein